jgi:hypothetical protein
MAYSSITKPSDYFNTVLYTGNGSTQSITGVGFQPDLNWIKKRSTADNHIIHQVGFNAGDYLVTNSTQELSNSGEMTKSLDSDGFTVGTRGEVNTNNSTFVSWNWLAGGTPSSNTDGSITSSVSANTTAGFSIVSYTGNGTGNSTIGHGLGAIPKFMIVKNRTTVQQWGTLSDSFNSASDPNIVYLSNTAAQADDTNVWGTSASFTTSTFTVGDWNGSNQSSSNFVVYCFAEKKGFSKFGSYTGNGNADGPFVYTGFKPAFLLYKSSTQNSNWLMYDSKRPGYNGLTQLLLPNTNAAEAEDANSSDACDLLSNGFKFRGTGSASNGSGQTFIYMAFAENPLVANVNGGLPATAR